MSVGRRTTGDGETMPGRVIDSDCGRRSDCDSTTYKEGGVGVEGVMMRRDHCHPMNY